MTSEEEQNTRVRLNRLMDAAKDAVEASPDFEKNDRLILLIDTPETGGQLFFGHGTGDDHADQRRAFLDLLDHVAALGDKIGIDVGVAVPARMIEFAGGHDDA